MDIRSALEKVKAVLLIIAKFTPGIQTDDAVIKVIDALLADAEMLGWFKTKVADSDSGVLTLESTPPVALQLKVEELRLDWGKLIEMLPVLIQLVSMFK